MSVLFTTHCMYATTVISVHIVLSISNLSHLIAMASLYFTKPHGEDEAKIKNNDLGYTFR